MPLLPGELGRMLFPDFADAIRAEAPHATAWRLLYVAYPVVAIHVLRLDGQPLVGLLLEVPDWPHKPPRVTPCSLDFRQRLNRKDIEGILKRDDGEPHVYDTYRRFEQGAYFCVEGTRDFHEDYGDALPWESVRHLGNFSPVAILHNVSDLLKRD